jgi:putative endonuclease
MFYVYILLCENGSYYTGYTNDLERRYQEHVQGTYKCKFTQSFKPVKIAQSWKIYDDKSTAMKIERFIKKLSKAEKEQIILFPDKLPQMYLD